MASATLRWRISVIRICEPEPSFELTLRKVNTPRPDGLVGVDAYLHTYDLAAGQAGASNWSISIAEEGGCSVADAALDGTVAEDAEFQVVPLPRRLAAGAG